MEQTWDIPLSERINIKVRAQKVDRSDQHPIGIHFAVMGFVKKSAQFDEVIRIDNSLHEGVIGVHIHFFDKAKRKGKTFVEYSKEIISPEQAISYVEGYLKLHYPMLW